MYILEVIEMGILLDIRLDPSKNKVICPTTPLLSTHTFPPMVFFFLIRTSLFDFVGFKKGVQDLC